MGQVATLSEVIGRLNALDGEYTIYASEPWTEESDAIVVPEPKAGGLPSEASSAGMKYFLEVNIARGFLEDWVTSLSERPTRRAICLRIIDYAINDA